MLAEEELNQHKLDRKIVNEEHWLRYGVSGRRKRNVKRLANLQALRETRRTYRGATGKANLAAAAAEKSGSMVLEAKGLSIAFDGRPIVTDFSTRIQRGDRIGIVGPNGSGKTTLVSLLTGALPPDAGTLRLGVNLEMATLDQHRESLDGETTLADALTGGRGDTVIIGDKPKHVVSYMQDFLFAKEQMRTPLRVLSGGERGRLMLARALAKPSNVLVLDEPTNDLDLETLDVLEEMLSDYPGTVLLISHDRDFLDRVVSGVIVPEGDGKWVEYAGGYSDMLKQRGADVTRPKNGAAKAETKAKADDAASSAQPQAAKRKLSLQREARAGDAAEDDGGIAGRDRQASEAARRPAAVCEGSQEVRRGVDGDRRSAREAAPGRGALAGAGDAAGRARGELKRHCERSEAIQSRALRLDCFVATLLAMTAVGAPTTQPHPSPPQRPSQNTPAAGSRRSALPSRAFRRRRRCRAFASA